MTKWRRLTELNKAGLFVLLLHILAAVVGGNLINTYLHPLPLDMRVLIVMVVSLFVIIAGKDNASLESLCAMYYLLSGCGCLPVIAFTSIGTWWAGVLMLGSVVWVYGMLALGMNMEFYQGERTWVPGG